MRFEEFLITQIDGKTPVEKIKEDLSYFEGAFNYATKSQNLYSNLIDNVVFILRSKYGRFDILYYNNETMYKELMLILTPQIPQFLMIQKKQLLESLDTFSSLQNWGQVDTDTVKRMLNLTGTSNNETSYIPLDGVDKDPYSANDVSNTEERTDNVLANRNVVNFLDFYRSITWNVADLELTTILAPYKKLFKMYYSTDIQRQSTPIEYTLEKRVEALEQEQKVLIEAVDVAETDIMNLTLGVRDNTATISAQGTQINNLDTEIGNVENKVDTNTTNISGLDNDVQTLTTHVNQHTQQINTNIANITALDTNKADKTRLDNYYTKDESDARFVSGTNYYTKQEADGRFGTLTQQQDNTNSILNINSNLANNFYNKAEIDYNFYNKTELNSKLGVKADYQDVYTRAFIADKLLNRTRTTVRNVRQAPTNFNGFWWCDFETEFYVGDNNVSPSYIEIVSCYIEGTSNQWFRVKPIKWYVNGGRVGVVLFTSSNGDMNNLATGVSVVINWFKSAYWETPQRISTSEYKG